MQMARNSSIRAFFGKGSWLFLLFILLLLTSMLYERETSVRFYTREDVEEFQEVLHRKENRVHQILNFMEQECNNPDRENLFANLPGYIFSLYKQEGLAVYVYHKDSLCFWSDNSVSVPELASAIPRSSVDRIGNAVFLKTDTLMKGEDSLRFVGLVLIKTEYPYENRFLHNGFQADFSLSPAVKIRNSMPRFKNPVPGQGYPVYSSSGEYLFSLDLDSATRSRQTQMVVCMLFYLITFFVFLWFLRRFIKNAPTNLRNILIILVVPFLVLVYYLLTHYRVPGVIFELELFSSDLYSRADILPSLGDLFILTVIIFFMIHNFYAGFQFRTKSLNKIGAASVSFYLISGLLALLLYLFNVFVFKSIIVDSSISFETYKVLTLSVYTFIGFLVLALQFTAFALVVDKVLSVLEYSRRKKSARIFSLVLILLIVCLFLLPLKITVSPQTTFFYSLIIFLLYYFRFESRVQYRFSTFLVYVLLFSVYTVFEVSRFSDVKSRAEMKMMAVNLSAEHDPVAELLFPEIDKRIKTDEEIEKMLFDRYFDYEEFYSYIQRKYFSGFWDKYDLQITPCRPGDSVYVAPPEDAYYHCYNFFYEYILQDGIQVPNTDFYYLDNLNGRISYFGALTYKGPRGQEVTLFIELDSRLISEGLGYPELLLKDRFTDNNNQFSWAKYNRGRLITSSGDFAYSMSSKIYTRGKEGFESIRVDKYDHLIYNIDPSNTIIVSKPAVFWVDLLISFSYIFSFYFIVLFLLLFVTRISPMSLRIRWNFKNKIQTAMTSLLFFSLILIGTGTVYFSIRQYKSRQTELLEEKIQSVYVELIHKLEFETDLHGWSTDEYFSLNELLQKFSNVIYTDINLFDGDGELLATSRPEIFTMDLAGNMMDAVAYKEMGILKRSEYIHNETIGGLKYLSAYVPFVNSENELLAYLNLPYFTRQDELTREITNLVVAIINIVVLLSLLSFTIAVFMSNRITHPLRLLQDNIARISLSSTNEKIPYQGHDEIGSLVQEYNLMVDQLMHSAELLARSERESAWREMAKQIAHEIKNPLTPMKLGIQHLRRIWEEREEGRPAQAEKITKTLIEQIDNLSAIATEFSNFAKMPVASNVKLDLVTSLRDAVSLFDEYDKFSIGLNTGGADHVYVYADREQINRVLINLIKNAMQSFPEGKGGKIGISLDKTDSTAHIRVRDNGKGIPEDIQDKLFQPNFTTKTSGMGMGLAIVKNIVETAGGEIWYETEINKGTTFHIRLPLANENGE